VQFPLHGWLAVCDCSDNQPTETPHNILLGAPPAIQRGRAGRRGGQGATRVYARSIPVFSFRLTPAPSIPRARCPRRSKRRPPMLILLAARPRYPSAAAIRSKSVPRPPGPRSRIVPVPATRPPGGFPPPPAARLPRASRPLRAAVAQQPMHRQHEAPTR